jgi:hypothetical protein
MGKSRALSIVVATAAATLVTGMTSAPADAASTYDPAPARSGAAWLADQVTDGLVHNEQYDFDDVGLSIDVALGLDAADKLPTVVKAITKAVSKNVASYTAFAPSVYAGPTAKAAVLALSQDKDPHAFGGVDLVAQLEARVATAAPITGRIEDAFDPTDEFGGDYANVIGQAYAAQALSLVGSAKATSVTAFLLAQQCDKGYFRQYFTADKTRSDQSCQGAPRAERGASTDATALAVLALQDVKGARAKKAVKRAVGWLEDTQLGSGGFTDTGKTSTASNTNSTGLAGWALGETGATDAAALAAAAVRAQQVVANPCAQKLAKHVGAIAYDFDTLTDGQGAGITKKTSDQWRRASAQALPVLRWAPRATGDLTITAPRTVAVGKPWTIRLTGVAAGERVCGQGANDGFERWPGRNPITRTSLVFDEVGSRTYTIWVGTQHRDVTVRVTG